MLAGEELKYTALYYSFVQLTGIEVSQMGAKYATEEEFIKDFGKHEYPFRINENCSKVKMNPKARIYSLRFIPYKALGDQYREHREMGYTDVALQAAKMKIHANKLLQIEDYIAIGEVAEILLEEERYQEAIDIAQRGLRSIAPLNAESIKFYCILMRAYFALDNAEDSDI